MMYTMIAAALVTTLVLLTSGGTDSKSMLDLEQGVIVHLFEWKWKDIAKECEDFLAPHGYKAVQISPPTENLVLPGRSWYERYQTVTYDFTTRSGDEKALADMIKRCNKVGVRVIADVILNHMTAALFGKIKCIGTGGNECNADEYSYPHETVQYKKEHFHDSCQIVDWKDVNQVRKCELSGLHDLDQSNTHVRTKMVKMLNRLIKLGIAGFRIDAAKHMDPVDLKAIFDQLDDLSIYAGFPRNTKPFIFQEVIDTGNNEDRGASQFEDYKHLGLVTDFRFSMEVSELFKGKNELRHLHNVLTGWGLKPSEHSVVFVENHDTERDNGYALNYRQSQNYKAAIAFMLAIPHGTPQILSSFDFETHGQAPPVERGTEDLLSPFPLENGFCRKPWNCQHRWRQICGMVEFHNVVKGEPFQNFVSFDGYQIAFCRGNKGFVAFNLQKGKALNERIQTCLPQGEYCDVISGFMENGQCLGKKVIVEKGGEALITMEPFNDAYNKDNEQDGILAIHAESNTMFKKPVSTQASMCAKIAAWRNSNFVFKAMIDKFEELNNCKS